MSQTLSDVAEKEIEEKTYTARILEAMGLMIGITGLVIGIINWQRAESRSRNAANSPPAGETNTESFNGLRIASIVALVASVLLFLIVLVFLIRRQYKRSERYLKIKAQKWNSVNYEGKKLTKREELLNVINTLRFQAKEVPRKLREKQKSGDVDSPIVDLYKITRRNIDITNRKIERWKNNKKNVADKDNPDFKEIVMENVPGF